MCGFRIGQVVGAVTVFGTAIFGVGPVPARSANAVVGAPADIECLDASLSAEAIAERFSFEGARLVAAEAVKLPVRVSPEYRFVIIAVAQPKTWDPEEPWGSDGQAWPEYDPEDPITMLPMDGAWLIRRLNDLDTPILSMDRRAKELTTWPAASKDLATDVEVWLAETRELPDCLMD